jgi:hypothetical protein
MIHIGKDCPTRHHHLNNNTEHEVLSCDEWKEHGTWHNKNNKWNNKYGDDRDPP